MSDHQPVDTIPCRRCGVPRAVRKHCKECRLNTIRRASMAAVTCARCGRPKYAYLHCRDCEIEKGKRVGRVDRTEAVTPTQRKERATL